MTQEEERIYLTELLIAATDWQVSEGETRSAIELEVIDRIKKLNGLPSINVVGVPSNEVKVSSEVELNPVITDEDFKALEAAKLNEHLANPNKVREAKERWKKGRVRVMVDGKPAWKKIEECVKQKCFPDIPDSTKWRWVWKGEKQEPVAEVCQPVDKLSDELWEAHEKGEE